MARLFDDASSEYMEVASTLLNSQSAWAVSFWAYPDANNIEMTPFFSGDKDVTNDRMFVAFRGEQAGDPVSIFVNGPGHTNTGNGFNVNQWNHVLAYGTDTDHRFVILNGDVANQAAQVNGYTIDGHDVLSFGRAGDSTPASYFSGRLADLAIWAGTGLTAADRAALAMGFSPRSIIPLPDRHWETWGNESPEPDRMGSGENMTVTGTARGDHPPLWFPTPARVLVPIAVAGGGFTPRLTLLGVG